MRRDGAAAISTYRYIINVDNTGTTEQRCAGIPASGCSPADPGYPASRAIGSRSPARRARARSTPRATRATSRPGIDLPDGRYLISVLADGYKLDGAHFTVPLDRSGPGHRRAAALPAARRDDPGRRCSRTSRPTNSAPDVPAEHGLAGFVGHIADYLGEVTTDVYGNPLCTMLRGRRSRHDAIARSPIDAAATCDADRPARCRSRARAASASATPTACWRSRTWAPTATRSRSRRRTAPAGSRPPPWKATTTGTPG